MRLLSGNPGMYQHSVEHSTEGETAQHEPEHGEDTIARVKGTHTHSLSRWEGQWWCSGNMEYNSLSLYCTVAGLVKAPLKRSRSTADGADEDSQEQLQEQLLESGGPEEEQRTDNTSLLRLLEEGEKVGVLLCMCSSNSHWICLNSLLCKLFQIQHMYRCARVQGLDTSEGLLLFGKEHFYVIDGYTMTMSREIRDIDTLPPK